MQVNAHLHQHTPANQDSLTSRQHESDGDVPALIPGGVFPDDLDTTSLALQVLPPSREGLIATLLDKMLEHVNEDGTFMVSASLNLSYPELCVPYHCVPRAMNSHTPPHSGKIDLL